MRYTESPLTNWGNMMHENLPNENLPLKCQHCGKIVKAIEVYCPHCGKRALATSDFYGFDVREQVFEVVVRQALKGAPWREICAGALQVNNITEEAIEEEVRKRRGNDGTAGAAVPKKPEPSPRASEEKLEPPQD